MAFYLGNKFLVPSRMFSHTSSQFIFEICCFVGSRWYKPNLLTSLQGSSGYQEPPKHTRMVRIPKQSHRSLSRPLLSY